MTWQNIFVVIIALLGFPIGLLVAKMTQEELKPGRKWFRLLAIAAAIAIAASIIFTQGETMLFLAAALTFVLLISIASLAYARMTSSRAKKSKRRYK